MKKIIVYSSKTGNTKKIAEAIHSLDRSVPLCSIDEIYDPTVLNSYEIIILGGWIDKGTLDSKSLKIAETLSEKKVGYFFTLGADPYSKHCQDSCDNIEALLLEKGNEIVGKFFCQGAIDPQLIAWMNTLPSESKMAPTEERKARWKSAESHPDEGDRVNAMRAFSQLMCQ